MGKSRLNVSRRTVSIAAVILAVVLVVVLWCVFAFMPYAISDSPKIIPPDTISEHDMAIVKNKLVLINTKGIMAYDKKGDYLWDYAMKTAEPYLTASGGKMAVADRENAAVWNLTGNNLNFNLEEENPVTGVVLNKNGYTGVISSEHGYRSIFTVYNDYGTESFKWYSGDTYITAAALADNNKNMAVAGINATSKAIQTVISFFDMNKTDPLGEVILDNTVAYKLVYGGTDVYVLTDKGVFCYNKKGALKYEYSFVGRTLHSFSFHDADSLAVALSCTDEAGSMLANSQVIALSRHLKEKCAVNTDFEVSAMDSKDGFIVVTGIRNAWLIKDSGKVKAKGTLAGDSERVLLFDKGKAFVTIAGSTVYIYNVHVGY